MTSAGARRALGAVAVALAVPWIVVACTSLDHLTGGPGNPDGSDIEASAGDVSASDGGTDGQACTADTLSDPKHCGRCGHDCLGAPCTAGRCEAIGLGSIPGAPLDNVVVAKQHVFVSTSTVATSQPGGIWRVPTSGGGVEPYVALQYAEQMAVLGDTLYFVVGDDPYDDAGRTGGLYSCPVDGSAPCVPTRVAIADHPRPITVAGGAVFYGENGGAITDVLRYVPPDPPVVVRADTTASYLFADGNAIFGVTNQGSNPQRAKLLELLANGTTSDLSFYDSPTANEGRLLGDPTAFFFTAFDFLGTAGGVVRRVPRASGVEGCDFGGTSNKRPYGLHLDPNRVYWTNQGEGASPPFGGGSVASCERAGCCTAPDVLWTGDGQPTGIAGDGDALYFVTYAGGSIFKVAKP